MCLILNTLYAFVWLSGFALNFLHLFGSADVNSIMPKCINHNAETKCLLNVYRLCLFSFGTEFFCNFIHVPYITIYLWYAHMSTQIIKQEQWSFVCILYCLCQSTGRNKNNEIFIYKYIGRFWLHLSCMYK